MATIYPKRKDGKIISVKLKVHLGRDEHGKRTPNCHLIKTWPFLKADVFMGLAIL